MNDPKITENASASSVTMPDFDSSGEHIRVTLTDAEQSWHCALIAGNEERTWWTENYVDRHGAVEAITWLGRFFSPVHRATVYLHTASGMVTPYAGWLDVWQDDQELGLKHSFPIQFVDERTSGDT